MYENLTNRELKDKARQLLEDFVAFEESGGSEDTPIGKRYLDSYNNTFEEMETREGLREVYIRELVS